jgi:hypothetical protein
MDDWSTVRQGDVVLGAKDGKAWEVIEKFDDGRVTIKNSEKRQYTLPVSGPVQIIATAAEIMAAAEATVKITLPGSEVVARIDNVTGVHRCPPTFREAASAQAHCYVLHGKRSTATNILDILAEHTRWHAANDSLRPHVHVKDFEV